MARTIIEDTGPPYVEDDSGPVLAIVVALIIAAAIVVLVVLFVRGSFDSKSGGTHQSPTNNAPSAPSQQQSQEPQPSQQPQPSGSP